MPHGADRRLMLLDRPLAVPTGTDAARGQGIRMITPQGVGEQWGCTADPMSVEASMPGWRLRFPLASPRPRRHEAGMPDRGAQATSGAR
jgi:hypothetical protein